MISLKKHLFNGLLLWTLCIFSLSCVDTRKFVYFNNIQDTTLRGTDPHFESVIQKNDLLSINVSSLNPQASSIFNLPAQAGTSSTLSTSAAGANGAIMPTGTAQTLGYLVAADGTIKFPVLGTIHAEGLSKKQLEKLLADSLAGQKLLVDPIVTVRFLNFRVTVLGEVARPTTINVSNEKISILEALGLAGDLTIYGKRDNVLLIREEGESKIIRRVDLNSDKILSSPYYYLKTNDVVYVEPNKSKIASTSRTQQLLPIVLSALSFVAIIVTYTLRH